MATKPKTYRLRLTTPGGTVHLAPTTYRLAREDCDNRLRLALLGSSIADAIDILLLDEGTWLPHTRRWQRYLIETSGDAQ